MAINSNCFLKNTCKRYNVAKNQSCDTSNDLCPKLLRMKMLVSNALLTDTQTKPFKCSDYGEGDMESYRALLDLQKNIYEFIKNGKSLYLYSKTVGNGKTSWAIRLMLEYFDRIWVNYDLESTPALFISVPKFLSELKTSFSVNNSYIDYVKQTIASAELVVWDELGDKCATDFEKDTLLTIINDRINSGKSNIYTSNLNEQMLKNYLGDRLFSRIWGLSERIMFIGSDKRDEMRKKKST